MFGPINITPASQEEFYKWFTFYMPDQQFERNRIREGLRLEEKFIFNKMNVCPLAVTEDIREELPRFKPQILAKGAQSEFYDPEIMKSIKCTLDALFYAPRNQNMTENIKYWMRDLMRIGEESAYGLALRPNFLHSEPFIIKTNKSRDKSNELFHEYTVGIILNNLREYIPNFVYVYTIFRCSPPIFEGNGKNVESWCNEGQAVNYIVMENISHATTLSRYVKDYRHNFSQILDKIMQIILSLHIAHNKYSFTHCDLHGNNILIRNIPDHKEFQIPYMPRTKPLYIKTDAIATIIDYGTSSIQIPGTGKIVSNINYSLWNVILPNRPFPIYDIYRLLLSLISITSKYRPDDIYPRIIRMAQFITQKPEETFKSRYYRVVPYDQFTSKITHDQFIDFLVENFYQEITSFSSNKPWENVFIFGCANNLCSKGINGILEGFGFINFAHHETFIDLYNNITKNFDITNAADYPAILETYPEKEYENVIYQLLEEEDSVVNNVSARLIEYDAELPAFIENFNDENFIYQYNQLLTSIMKDVKELSYMIHLANMATKLAVIYDNSSIMNIINDIVAIRQEVWSNQHLDNIWKKLQNHNLAIQNMNDGPIAKWWTKHFPLLFFSFRDMYILIKTS